MLYQSVWTSLSVNKILLPRYMNWFTSFRSLPFKEEMAPFSLKHMESDTRMISFQKKYKAIKIDAIKHYLLPDSKILVGIQ